MTFVLKFALGIASPSSFLPGFLVNESCIVCSPIPSRKVGSDFVIFETFRKNVSNYINVLRESFHIWFFRLWPAVEHFPFISLLRIYLSSLFC